MNTEILALVERHCGTLRREFDEIERAFDAALSGGAGLSRLRAAAHKIKGSSGSLGFARVSALAERYEHALRQAEASGIDAPALRDAHDALGAEVAAVRPEGSALWTRFAGGAGG